MKVTVVVPPNSTSPPQMPVEGSVIAETMDGLGWQVWFLDVAAFSMTTEAVRIETKKEEPDMAIFLISRHQYRYAKQYVAPIRGNLPKALLVASTDLNLHDLKEWIPELDYVIRGPPVEALRVLSTRTQTRNLDDIPAGGEVKLPQYHPLTTNFEQHAHIRGGRFADIPVSLFGQQITGDDLADCVMRLRLKYAIQGFNLLGPIPDVKWLLPALRKLEDKELVGAPANLTWTCEVPNPMDLTTPVIRELADHGARVLTFDWRRGMKQQIEHVLDTASRASIQPLLKLNFGPDNNIYDYVEMAKLLQANESLPVQPKFVEDENRLNDEEYVSSLTNGNYLPKSRTLHSDMQLLAIRDLLLSRDVERLEKYAQYTSH